MGKRSKEKVGKKERRRAEAAALAKSTWLTQAAGLPEAIGRTETAARTGRQPPVADDLGGASSGRPDAAEDRARRAGPRAPADHARTVPTGDLSTVVLPAGVDTAGPVEAPRSVVDATELAARLASLSTVLQRDMGRTDAGDGLTRARLSALSLLVLGGPRTLGDLAAAEHVRPPTMTRLVHAMEAEGLVAREPHPTDGRSIIIRATAGGEALLGQGRAHQIASLARAIADLDDADRLRLSDAADLLGRVVRDSGRETGDRPA
jgi:DNA-binding MarR family transcriptional regulator